MLRREGVFNSPGRCYWMGLPVRPGHHIRVAARSFGPRWAPGLAGVCGTLPGRGCPLPRRQRALGGCYVGWQKGNPVKGTGRAVLSGTGTLRLFYVACDHGRCGARGGRWGKAHLYGRLGFFNVAFVHMRSDVVRGKGGGGGGEAYLRGAGLRRRLWGRGLPIVHLAISTGAGRGAA